MNVFVFFRDFRIEDNLGLYRAMKQCGEVVPIFCFTPEQIEPSRNDYFSHNSVQFLCESLLDLRSSIQSQNGELYIFHNDLTKVLKEIHQKSSIRSIHYNRDYTPYTKKRSSKIKSLCKSLDVTLYEHEDYLLAPIGTFMKPNDDPYTVYGPFKNNVYKSASSIPKPKMKKSYMFKKQESLKQIQSIEYNLNKFYNTNNDIYVHGGRQLAKKLLQRAKKLNYETDRNTLSIETSRLSAYIKYGNVSIREAFHALYGGKEGGLCNQFIWREFYYYIAYYYPEVLSKSANFQKKYDNVKWVTSKSLFKKWCDGETGYPIVDACMKQLNKTGYMHNRGRLISANFLNRMLGMDWRLGEKYFATKLTDYDPIVNNGNWQWIASTGVDPKPYFQRLFNPWSQSQKADQDAKYIKQWLPQLKNIPANELHEWDKHVDQYDLKEINYRKPIVDYKTAREKSIQQYRDVL